jgi:hypothetical protein
MVMREGMAWGFTIRSGTMPSLVKGMSSCRSTSRGISAFSPEERVRIAQDNIEREEG